MQLLFSLSKICVAITGLYIDFSQVMNFSLCSSLLLLILQIIHCVYAHSHQKCNSMLSLCKVISKSFDVNKISIIHIIMPWCYNAYPHNNTDSLKTFFCRVIVVGNYDCERSCSKFNGLQGCKMFGMHKLHVNLQ